MPLLTSLKKKYPLKSADGKDWLLEEIDSHLAYTKVSSAGVFYASDLGDSARILVLKFLGVIKEDISADSARRMETGKALHDRWGRDLAKSGILIASEKNVIPYSSAPLRGRLDFVVRRPLDRSLWLIEVKTTSPDNFYRLSEPAYSALCQWTFYSNQEGILDGCIIYEAPHVAIKSFCIKRDGPHVRILNGDSVIAEWPNLVNIILEKVDYAFWCVNNDKFPERCPECLSRCKYPDLCGSRELKTVSQDEWRRIKQVNQ